MGFGVALALRLRRRRRRLLAVAGFAGLAAAGALPFAAEASRAAPVVAPAPAVQRVAGPAGACILGVCVPTPSLPTPSLPTPSLPTPSLPTPSLPTPSLPTPSLPTPSLPAPPPPPPRTLPPTPAPPKLPQPSPTCLLGLCLGGSPRPSPSTSPTPQPVVGVGGPCTLQLAALGLCALPASPSAPAPPAGGGPSQCVGPFCLGGGCVVSLGAPCSTQPPGSLPGGSGGNGPAPPGGAGGPAGSGAPGSSLSLGGGGGAFLAGAGFAGLGNPSLPGGLAAQNAAAAITAVPVRHADDLGPIAGLDLGGALGRILVPLLIGLNAIALASLAWVWRRTWANAPAA